jgi:peptidyl-prolyl cis-trans isomerase SurA
MPIPALFLMLASAQSPVVIDRIAVIVGKHAIKTSDIVEDLRVTEFLNREPLGLGPAAKRKSAERLIDQEIIRQEIATGGYRRPSEAEGQAYEKQLENDRFHGSAAQMRQALAKYDLTEEQLREELLWQLTVLRFIDQRFRAGVLVTDEEVKSYYDQHLAALRAQYPNGFSLEELQAKVRSSLEGERINQSFNEWLEQQRKMYRIEYRQEAFE